MKRKRGFDALEMKRRAQEQIYNKIGHLSAEEQLAYWQQRNKEFRERVAKLKGAVRRKPPIQRGRKPAITA